MRYTILTKGDSKSNALKHKMINHMKDFQMVEDSENPEIVISVGGDGTLLQAFHQYSHMLSKVAFVGIHTGHLGFYADWLPHEVEKLIIEINNSEFQVIEYPLLELIVRYNDNGYETRYLALNEATMKTENGSTLVVDVNIRGKHFERFRGDGLCISTPSGSTAYNKALGGALIHPSLEAMQIAEIASINNRVFRTVGSPLVLPKHHTCLITPVNHDTIRTTIDHVSIKHKNVNAIQYRVANEKVRFARFRPFPFWKRVHDSFTGKSTIANAAARELFEQGYQVIVLDGDNIRHGLNRDLGFSDEDRKENIRRIGEVAKLFVQQGTIVITAFISPFREDRQQVRELVEAGEFNEVYIKCDLDICEQRDPKGLYKKARNGEIPFFTGIDSPYEEPEAPELVLDSGQHDREACKNQLIEFVKQKLS